MRDVRSPCNGNQPSAPTLRPSSGLRRTRLPSNELKRTVAVLNALHPVVYGPLPTVREKALRTKLLIKAFDEILLVPAEKLKQ